MTLPRILIYGNAGSGKTTMARALAQEFGIPHLSLDDVAWEAPAVRCSAAVGNTRLLKFIAANPGWAIEGCYADLIEVLLPHCSELRFLNPGIETCVAQCLRRPWEPDKYPTLEAQNEMLQPLIEWVRQYETRTDEYSLTRHRALFDNFSGPKREYPGSTSVCP